MTRDETNAMVRGLRGSLRPSRPTRLRSWLRNALVAVALLAVIASCVVGAASAHAAGLT